MAYIRTYTFTVDQLSNWHLIQQCHVNLPVRHGHSLTWGERAKNLVVICNVGRVGRALGSALRSRYVIELNILWKRGESRDAGHLVIRRKVRLDD